MPAGARPDPPPHSIRLIVAGTYGGDTPVANTLWVRNGNAQTPGAGDFDSFVLAMGNLFVSSFKPLISNAMVWTNADAYYYDVGGIALASSRTITGQGNVTAKAFPASVALCIGWQVQQHYKGGHPRTYLVGPDSGQTTGGRRFTTVLTTGAVAGANNFHASVNAGGSGNITGVKLGVVSFVNKGKWRDPPIFRDFVPGGAHCDTRVDSQRRRLGRDIPP
jgi:hypothetical protein